MPVLTCGGEGERGWKESDEGEGEGPPATPPVPPVAVTVRLV